MYLKLIRTLDNGNQTTGTLRLWTNEGNCIARFDTLEPSWLDNKRNQSCIPIGYYIVSPTMSFRFGKSFEVKDVKGRSGILFHAGNYRKDTQGCILIGHGYTHLDQDFNLDLKNSKIAMKTLLELVKKDICLVIENEF